ncbi:hypothetical protein FHG87_020551 [Trinorchestia longiramus]|nr:hypothetical protein FHG87_020551 [Trinorchestia longiramus]
MRSMISVLLLAAAAMAQPQPEPLLNSVLGSDGLLGGLLGSGGNGLLSGVLGGPGAGGLLEGVLGGDGLVGGLDEDVEEMEEEVLEASGGREEVQELTVKPKVSTKAPELKPKPKGLPQ